MKQAITPLELLLQGMVAIFRWFFTKHQRSFDQALLDVIKAARAHVNAVVRDSFDAVKSYLRLQISHLAATKEIHKTDVAKLDRLVEDLTGSEKYTNLGSMVAGLSHEIASPISTAVNMTEVMKERLLKLQLALDNGDVQKAQQSLIKLNEALGIVERSVGAASGLIHGFKTISVDRASERRRTFNLAIETRNIAETLRASARRYDVKIDIDIPPMVLVEGYPGKYGQIISILLNNAYTHAFPKESAATQPTIRIRIARLQADQADNCLAIVFEDNGCGFEKNFLPDVFSPFHTSKPNDGGSGLGLFIARHIARKIGGDLSLLVGTDFQGAAFKLLLPAKASAL